MSDIAGPPAPKPVSSQNSGTDRAARTSRDPQQSSNQATDEKGEKQSERGSREAAHARDPAVSISSSAAHLQTGEKLRETVRALDSEGRPIIETEKASFALRPDVGLKPGDKVELEIKETGKQIRADLLKHNEIEIRPPLRLSLTVTAVHGKDALPQETLPEKPLDPRVNYPLKSPSGPLPLSTSTSDPEALAALLAKGTSPSTRLDPNILSENTAPQVKSSSQDLATLIATQNAAAGTSQPPSNTGDSTTLGPFINIQHPQGMAAHLLGTNSLTAPLQSAIEAALSATKGLDAPVTGYTAAGTAINVQLLDISISQVSPTEIAQVISVQPLSPDMAKALPVNAQSIGAQALASVNTDTKGTLILPQTYAEHLSGETIRVTSAETIAASNEAKQTQASHEEIKTYSANLQAPGSAHSRKVDIALIAGNQPAASQLSGLQHTTVSAVHTLRAFLTGDGPMNDLKLDTAIGALSLTLPSGLRPQTGDLLAVMPQQTQQGATGPLTQAPHSPVVQTGMADTLSAAGAITASSWPSFEQAYSLLQATSPEAAAQLAGKSAQGGGKLLNSMMFLMAALKGGSPSSWLGRASEAALQKQSGNLLSQFKEDIAKLWNGGTETTAEWRSFLLPLDARGSDMPMIAALFANAERIDPDHDKEQGKQDTENGDSKRFIIEASFSELGAMQLEGLIRQKQFDLILWSEHSLPETMTTDLSGLFTMAVEANGFNGRLSFRAEEPFPVDVAAVLQGQLAA